MLFDPDDEIWKACAQDEARPMLRYAIVERLTPTAGMIVAVDGFIVAGVPCQLYDGEQTGPVHADALKIAAKTARARGGKYRHNGQAMLEIRDDTILLDLGETFPRWNEPDDKDGTLPNWRDVWPENAYAEPGCELAYNAINAESYLTLCQALGQDYLKLWRPKSKYGTSALYIYAMEMTHDRQPLPPFGLMMGIGYKDTQFGPPPMAPDPKAEVLVSPLPEAAHA